MDVILFQVWSIIWISLVSFSIATATVVTVSFNSLTFLRCLGREESFRLLLDIDINTEIFQACLANIPNGPKKNFFDLLLLSIISPPSGTLQ